MSSMVYRFPEAPVVFKRMEAAALSANGDFLRVFERFAQNVGGSEKVAPGVNLAFQLAAYDASKVTGSMPYLSAMCNMQFETLMGSVIDDNPEFLAEVIEFFKETMK